MKKEKPSGAAASASRPGGNSEQTPAEPDAEAREQPPAVTAERPTPSRDRTKSSPTPKRPKRQRHAYTAEFIAFWDAYRAKAKVNPGSKARAAEQWQDARQHYTAEDLAAMLDRYAAGRARDRAASSDGFIPDAPDLCNWLEHERWDDYTDAPVIPGSSQGDRTMPADTLAREKAIEAVMGPWSPPDLPADLSPEDYRAAVHADKTDWRTASGRWERSTVAA